MMLSRLSVFSVILFGCFRNGSAGFHHGHRASLSGPPVRTYAYGSGPPYPETASSASAFGFPTSNRGCFPNIIRNPVPTDLRDWDYFTSIEASPSTRQVYNAFFTNTLVGSGLVFLPATTTLAIHVAELYRHTTISNNCQSLCVHQNVDFLSRLDGVTFLQYFDTANGGNNPLYLALYYLYNDPRPNGLDIVYLCNKFNFVTGICDDPSVFVNVRVHPNQMSATDKNAIDDIIDKTLQPYCMSTADLQTTVLRVDLGRCTDPPAQGFLNLVAGYDASLARPPLS